jgi:hypothetical protein
VVTLRSNNLVVVLSAQVHAVGSPGVEVGSDIDGAAGAVVLADGPVLLKGRGAVDGGLVGAGGLEDVVDAAVDGDGALEGGGGGGVVGAEGLDDVVLDQGAAGPAVDGEVAVAVGAEGSGVGDGPKLLVGCYHCYHKVGSADLLCLSWVPSLSCDEVALAAPGHGVLTAGLVGVCCLALVVTPEGVVVPTICTSLVRALLETGVGAGWLFSGEDAGDGGRSNEEVGEGDHFVG